MRRCGSRGWVAALMAGYALFYAILFAETAYVLPRLLAQGYADFPAERFRAEWFRGALQIAPLRWLACCPCQQYGHLGVALLPAAVLLLALGYLGALRAVLRRPEAWSFRRLLAVASLTALPLALLMPPTSGDYVAYLFTGRLLSVYHVSPWHHALAEFPAEQCYLSPAAWGAGLQCVYGPVWGLVAAFTTGIAHGLMPGAMTFGSLMLNVLLLRGASALAFAAGGAAVWRITRRRGSRQQRLMTAGFLFNPLLVYEAIGALHNDIWGVLFLLWACALFLEEDDRFLVPLALSFLIKYIAVAMVPFIAVYYWRRRDGRRLAYLAGTTALCAGLVLLTSASGLRSVMTAGREQFLLSATCLPQFLAMGVTLTRGLPVLDIRLVHTFSRALTVIFGLVCLALLGRTRTREQVLFHTFLALALYLAGAYVQTVSWYFLWPVALLCAVEWGRADEATVPANALWASTLALLGYGVPLWNHAGLHGWAAWTILPGFLAAVAAPALVCLAGRWGWWSVCPQLVLAGVERGSRNWHGDGTDISASGLPPAVRRGRRTSSPLPEPRARGAARIQRGAGPAAAAGPTGPDPR